MPANLLRLLIRYLLLAAGVVLLNFLIPRLLPGDPLGFMAGEGTDGAVPLSTAARDQLRSYYHLDQPPGRQLASYLSGLPHGDFGQSIARSTPVRDLIVDRLPWTLGLLLGSLLLSLVAGTTAGVAAGWCAGQGRDRLLVSVASVLVALPEILLAIGLALIFAVGLGWVPLFGGETLFASYGEGVGAIPRRGLDIAWHLALPAATLVLAGGAAFLLLARDVTAGLRHEPWLTVARAKGLREHQVARSHLLPNIALPLLAFAGPRLGGVLGGALVVERVFGLPGVGSLGYEAIRARDYPLLQALFLLSSLGVLVANLVVDLASLSIESRRGSGDG